MSSITCCWSSDWWRVCLTGWPAGGTTTTDYSTAAATKLYSDNHSRLSLQLNYQPFFSWSILAQSQIFYNIINHYKDTTA